MSSDDRRQRLPKWAQQELQRLEREIAHAKARLAEGPADSCVIADPYSDPPRPLGSSTSIDFRFGDEWSDRINVRIDDDGGGIKVIGGSRLIVLPSSSNVIRIETRER